MGQATLRETMRSGGGRIGRATAYNSIGAALSATGLGLAAIPVVMGVRVAESRVTGALELGNNLIARTADLDSLQFSSI